MPAARCMSARTKTARPRPAQERVWQLRLYVAGQYRIEVIDLLEKPQLARGDQILAIPTLVRKLPVPVRKIIGDLSNTERVLIGLDLRPADETKGRRA